MKLKSLTDKEVRYFMIPEYTIDDSINNEKASDQRCPYDESIMNYVNKYKFSYCKLPIKLYICPVCGFESRERTEIEILRDLGKLDKKENMAKKNRNNIEYPDKYMKDMKKKKHKKIRNIPIDKEIIENKYNDAERIL